MSVVNVTLGDGKNLNLPLGRQGENEVTAVVFDFSAWSTEFGSGTLSLSVQRHGDELPYAVTMTTSGTNATWTISELDTAYKGTGEAQVKYTVGTKVKKSAVYKFTVNKSLGQNGEYPSPGQTWQEEIEDELADVKQDLEELQGGVPTNVRQALNSILESAVYLESDLTDEFAIISAWAADVTEITLNQTSISISGSNTFQLVATTKPSGKPVTWESSDDSVATVSNNGLVTGVGNGTVTITATAGDLSATCVATVSGFATLVSISAVYTQSGVVFDTDSLDDLRDDLVVTALYNDSSTIVVNNYTLSGTLEVGTSTIVVSFGGKTTTFDVTVTYNPVPNIYQRVEYVASYPSGDHTTGTYSYINTGKTFASTNSNKKIEIGIMTERTSISNYFIGVRTTNTGSSNTIGFGLGAPITANNQEIGFWIGSFCGIEPEGGSSMLNNRYDLVAEFTASTNGMSLTDGDVSNTATASTVRNHNNMPICLFALLCEDNAKPQAKYAFYGRIYYAKVYEGGDLILDLYPCYRLSDNEVGMYDAVSGTFMSGYQSGLLEKGSDI